MELGPARPPVSQAYWHEKQKGRTIARPARRGRAPRPAPPRRARSCASGCRRSTSWPRTSSASIPATEPIPVLPGGALHDGRHPRRRPTASPLPGLYSAGECSSVGIHGANRLGSNSLTELLVFGKVAGDRGRGTLRQERRARRPALGDLARGRAQPRSASIAARRRRPSASRRCATRWRRAWKTAAASTAPARRCRPPATSSRELQAALQATSASTTTRGPGTPNGCSAIELGYLLDVAQAMAHSALERRESRGSHQRLDGFEHARRRRTSSSTRLAHYRADGAARHRLRPGEDHHVAARARAPTAPPAKAEAERKPRRADACLRPLQDDRDPGAALPARAGQRARAGRAIDVPFTDDMSVLQGLQYIKDDLDGTLSFRWSCRMAICGSCGMMINGKPQLSCKTFLRDYCPGPVRDRAAGALPDRARPGRRRRATSSRSSRASSRTSSRSEQRVAGARRIPADAGAARRSSSSSARASTACCAMPPARSSG